MTTGPRADRVVAALLAVCGLLLLWNLNNGLLWQDEAETAVLARNTLAFGYPRVSDGHNVIEIQPWLHHGPGQSWIYSPWLPFYLLAGVFAIVGESTWSARLPFALAGWLSVYLAWRLVRLLTGDRTIQRLTVALLTCSVAFLVLMRQCRYYAVATALVLGICLAYLRFLRGPTWLRAGLVGVLLVLLFHTNAATFLPLAAVIVAHQARFGTPMSRRRALVIGTVAAMLILPVLPLFVQPGHAGVWTLGRVEDHFETYIRVLNKHVVPLAFMGVSTLALAVASRRSRRSVLPPVPDRAAVAFLGLVAAAQLAFFVLVPDQRHLRYLAPIFPLLFIVEAWWLTACLRAHRLAGGIITALVLFTNVLQSPHVQIPLGAFLTKLTVPYVGPMEGVVGYLRQHARAGDTVKIPYDDRTLMFYTSVVVEPPSAFTQESDSEWVVIRRDWIPSEFFQGEYFRKLNATYERIELAAPDVQWQDREDVGQHQFRTVTDAPRIVIYRKRGAARGASQRMVRGGTA